MVEQSFVGGRDMGGSVLPQECDVCWGSKERSKSFSIPGVT